MIKVPRFHDWSLWHVSPDNQMSEVAFMDYAKTLPHITSDKLTKQMTHDDMKIHTLRQAMDFQKVLTDKPDNGR